MCDTLVIVGDGTVWFAKNSDRDANEAQVLDWQPRRRHRPGSTVRCTWIEIPQVGETWAVVLSRPFWMWGAEIGANEHGVVIGNEAVFTRRPKAATGLTGMDLLRLALERSASAAEAVETIVSLLEQHGQGGGCGYENRSFTYHNSFLVADASGAFVLETAARHWTSERVSSGVRTISNVLTIPDFARAHGERLYTWAAGARRRRSRTTHLGQGAGGVAGLLRILRDHGPDDETPRYRWLNGTLGAPCMHGGGTLASSVTTASWVSELTSGGARHWATATSAPCLSLFKPVRIDEPVDLGSPRDRADDSLWWRHERLHRRVLTDPARLGGLFLAERDAIEASWLADPPAPADAFAQARERLAEWDRDVTAALGRDVRPPWARLYWRRRNALAGLNAGA